MQKKVLFVCNDNSERSQIAEAYLNVYGQGRYTAKSAGFEPAALNEDAIIVMSEDNIDISKNLTKSVFELYKNKERFDYVITICSQEREADCPVFYELKRRVHWDLEIPADLTDIQEKRLYYNSSKFIPMSLNASFTLS